AVESPKYLKGIQIFP
ncbi:jg18205, partial [Pararge aegeria aegeria]